MTCEEIVMPAALFLAFIEDNVCPCCLGCLRMSELCPECGADLKPALDTMEGKPQPYEE